MDSLAVKLLFLLLIFSQTAFAGLPPTSTKGSGDTNPVTTFEIDWPNIPLTHTGTKASVGAIPNSALSTAANLTIKSNISGGTATDSDNTVTSILDAVFTSTQGSILYRGASNWAALGSGTSGQVLNTGGGAANPSWGGVAAAQLPAPSSGAFTTNIDWSVGKNVDYLYTLTLSANTTLTWSNLTAGETIVMAITNTASNWTVTWPATAHWPAATAPVQTVGAHTDIYTCKAYSGTDAYCSVIQNY